MANLEDLAFGTAVAAAREDAICISCTRLWTVAPSERLCPSCAVPLRRVTPEQAAVIATATGRAMQEAEQTMHAGGAAASAVTTAGGTPGTSLASLDSVLLAMVADALRGAGGASHQLGGLVPAGGVPSGTGFLLDAGLDLGLLDAMGLGMGFGDEAAAGGAGAAEPGIRPASKEAVAALPRIVIKDPVADLPHHVRLQVVAVRPKAHTEGSAAGDRSASVDGSASSAASSSGLTATAASTADSHAEEVVGTHECVAVPASFSGPVGEPAADSALLPLLVPSDPPTGASWPASLAVSAGADSAATAANPYWGAAVLFDRGAITFAKKGLQAQAAGAAAGIVVQAADKAREWPLEMVDAGGEVCPKAGCPGSQLRIPFVAVSVADGAKIRALLSAAAGKAAASSGSAGVAAAEGGAGSSSSSSSSSSSAAVCTGAAPVRLRVSLQRARKGAAEECLICCDTFAEGHTVVTLPCQHVLHEACVTPWLQRRNTCPCCRHALPLEPRAAAAEAAEARLREAMEAQRKRQADMDAASASWYS